MRETERNIGFRGSKRALPKRFYKDASVALRTGTYGVLLDGRPVRTPGGRDLVLPSLPLANAIKEEWCAQAQHIDRQTMALNALAITAIDAVTGRESEVRADIAKYALSDLICYRAEHPPELAALQAKSWDSVLDWTADALGARFRVVGGLMPAAQDAEALAAMESALATRDAFHLAALQEMTALTGSALLALAHTAGHLDDKAAWAAAHVDEDWQISRWGEDDEAQERRQYRWRDFYAASQFLVLLK